MEEKLLESIVSGFTKTLIEESKNAFKNLVEISYDEIKQYIGKDLNNYLTKHKDKYSHIKTLLRGNTPVYLYDIYFPSKLIDEEEKEISTDSVSQLMKDYKYLTIIGDAGSGKSTLIKHLFLNAILERKFIPILVELRYLNDFESSFSFEDFIKNICNSNKIHSNDNILERFFEKGKFIFFLDGFDELDQRTKKRTVKQLNDFIEKYDKNSFILTSRPYSNIENLPLFVNLSMKELSLEGGEIRGFVYKQLGLEKELAEKAIRSIEQGEIQYIKSFLVNPLLLSLYLLTFQNYASIPDKKYIFYRRVINALFSEHDSRTKLGFVREKQCGMDQEQFEEILKSFSFLSYFENQFIFDSDYVSKKLKLIKSKKDLNFNNHDFITDLKSAISLWVDDDGEISFSHRSLQEYFTALFISELKDIENERVYEKIINKFNSKLYLSVREIENLLMLLKEIDLYNYTTKFYYKLLLILREDIESIQVNTFEKKFVKFFISGVQNRRYIAKSLKTINLLPSINNLIRKTIVVHLPYTKKLNDYISLELQKNKIYDYKIDSFINSKAKKQTDSSFRFAISHLEFNDSEFEEFFNLLDIKIVRSIAKEFQDFLSKEIEITEKFISDSISNEKDLVDLI